MKALLASAALILLSADAFAAPAAPTPPPPPPGAAALPPLPLKRTDVPMLVARQFAALDTNHDGGVTEAEIRAGRRARRDAMVTAMRDHEFARMDADHDGKVSRAEFDAPPPPPGGKDPAAAGAPPPPPGRGHGPDGPGGPHGGHGPFGAGAMLPFGGHMFEEADADKDGKVTLAEAQAYALARFDKADANHDGTLDRDEVRALLPHGPGHGGPRGRGGPDGDMPPPPPPPPAN